MTSFIHYAKVYSMYSPRVEQFYRLVVVEIGGNYRHVRGLCDSDSLCAFSRIVAPWELVHLPLIVMPSTDAPASLRSPGFSNTILPLSSTTQYLWILTGPCTIRNKPSRFVCVYRPSLAWFGTSSATLESLFERWIAVVDQKNPR